MPEDRDDRSLLEIAYEGLDKLPDYPSIERSSDTLMEMLDDTADLIADMTANGPAAIGLYESLGYVRWGTHPVYARVDGRIVPGHYYYKLLDDEPAAP